MRDIVKAIEARQSMTNAELKVLVGTARASSDIADKVLVRDVVLKFATEDQWKLLIASCLSGAVDAVAYRFIGSKQS